MTAQPSAQWAPIPFAEVLSLLRAELANDEDQVIGAIYDLDAGAIYGTLDGRVLREQPLGSYEQREARPLAEDADLQSDLLRRIAQCADLMRAVT